MNRPSEPGGDRGPDANIGIATGRNAGFWVLDIDSDKGGDDSIVALERSYGPLPQTGGRS